MSDGMGVSAGQPQEPETPLNDGAGDATPDAQPETADTSTAQGVPLRTRDVGVFEGAPPEYVAAADTASRRAGAGAPRRPRGWLAYMVFVLVVLLALLVRFAVFNTPPAASTHSQAAASAPSPTATTAATVDLSPTATPSPGITPNATLPVNTGGGPVPTPGAEMPFTVTAAEISSAPTTYDGYCAPPDTMIEHFEGFVYVPGTTPGGTITYRWRFSNGTITPVQSVLIGPTNRPLYYGAANDQLITGEWAVDPATADGSRKWAEFEVLTPSHLLSPPTYFWFKCEYAIRSATASVSGGNGGTPPTYSCTAGGDQTFTFTGTISVFSDPHSHTVTYHWLRYDGTQGPDQSVTLSPGQYSANVQPDTVVVSKAKALANTQQYGTQPEWEQIIVTSSSGVPTYQAQYFAWC